MCLGTLKVLAIKYCLKQQFSNARTILGIIKFFKAKQEKFKWRNHQHRMVGEEIAEVAEALFLVLSSIAN